LIISTKGRYGVRAMFELALQSDGAPVSIKSIAERQSISETYLEQLFQKLRQAGLLTSLRGAQGGYLLAKPPGEISVGDILKALEGPLRKFTGLRDKSHLVQNIRGNQHCSGFHYAGTNA